MKLYSDESGYEQVRAFDVLIISCLARVEVPAALWRKHRSGELSASDARVLIDAFESDYYGGESRPPRLAVIGLPAFVLDDAARNTVLHGLRAYAAVQLASARSARLSDPECGTLVCFDQELRRAALIEGFQLIP
ncbi:MAG: type II toxin-antitoxin system VapC family toxin [Actinomycetota bacterium]